MGCSGRRLLTLLLLVSTATAATFDECFPRVQLYPFWSQPLYVAENPHILKLGFGNFYFFEFDNASQELSMEGVRLSSGADFLQSLPPDSRQEFSQASASLDSASNSAQAARQQYQSAHLLSKNAAAALALLLSPQELALLMMPDAGQPVSYARLLLPAWHAYDLSVYGAGYSSGLWQSHQEAANAFDSSNTALHSLALKCDSLLQFLDKAGAGSSQYNGGAREPFAKAQSLLSSSSQKCSASGSKEIASYFSSSPGVPDLSQVHFAEYLQETAGRGENSSLSILAATYSELSGAQAQMKQEYSNAIFSAKASAERLSDALAALSGEKLELIGEQPAYSGSQYALVGSSFSGVLSGYRKAGEELAASQQMMHLSESSARAEETHDYLANSISFAREAEKKSQSALLSLPGVRSNAEAIVTSQRQLAEGAISLAEQKLGAKAGSFEDAQAFGAAQSLLDEAKQKTAAAASYGSLGERYRAYSDALRAASEASARADSRFFLPEQSSASQSLYSLESLLKNAQKDGLDVEYEIGRAQQYRQLLQSSSSQETFQIISRAAEQDRQSVLLRLAEEYSPLDGKYGETSLMVLEIRKSEQGFLPQFDSLEQYFPGGTIDIGQSAGRLSYLQKQLEDFSKQCVGKMPVHLSLLLSESASIQEILDQPTLGKSSRYSATIFASNPTGFPYSGSLSFPVQTQIPIYSADFVSGDHISDAFYEGGKAILVLPGISEWQKFSFLFSKSETPAQITSSQEECYSASVQGAAIRRSIQFFTTRHLPSLQISEGAPQGSSEGRAAYAGREYLLTPAASGESTALQGEISGVAQGKNSLELSYEVSRPFSTVQSTPVFEKKGIGTSSVAYEISVEGATTDCSSALVSIDEPYSSITGFSAVSLGQEKISQAKATATSTGTRLSFLISPLRKGKNAKVSVSYALSDESLALSEALAFAEAQSSQSGLEKDKLSLAKALLLANQSRVSEALIVLEKMRQDGQELLLSSAEYSQFLQENSSAMSLLSSESAAQASLSGSNMAESAARLSTLSSKLSLALQSSSQLFGDGKYPEALKGARKASADYRASLAELAWDSATEASSLYAKAAKTAAPSDALSHAQKEISDANALYSEGKHLESFLSSSKAKSAIAAISEKSLADASMSKEQTATLAADFEALRADAEKLLSKYSSQFSALSAQSKKRLPITPAAAQQKIDGAEKGMAAASKAAISSAQTLLQANRSYEALAQAHKSIQDSLDSLQGSASSSLEVARAALSEAKLKASQGQQKDLPAIEFEVANAEEFLADSLYSESILASDRAIKASNALLSKSGGGVSAATLALAALSLAFIAAAAYYFSKQKKPGQALGKNEEGENGKKKVAKAD